jgi:hypothetical protein
MTKNRKPLQSVPFKGVTRVLTTLLEHPDYGAIEEQVAAVNDISIRKVHRAVRFLAMHGVIRIHPASVGNRLTLNLNHPLLDPITEALGGSIAAAAYGIAETLRLKNDRVAVAVDWRSDLDRPAKVLATVPNYTDDGRIFELRAQLEHEVGRFFLAPQVKIRRWADFRHLLETGHPATKRMWEHGEQLVGDDPITREALRHKLRWSLITWRERLESEGRDGSGGDEV